MLICFDTYAQPRTPCIARVTRHVVYDGASRGYAAV